MKNLVVFLTVFVAFFALGAAPSLSTQNVRIVAPIDGGSPISVSGAVTLGAGAEIKITDGTDDALVSGTGSLQVTCDNCGGASPFEDNDAFTAGTSAVGNAGLFVDDTAPASVSENSAGAQRMTPNRSAHTVIRDGAGNERAANVTASNALSVDGSGVTQPVSGTLTCNLAAGTNNIGDVDVITLPSVTIGTFPDNEPINVAQMNGTAVTMGNGVSGTGVQRVTIASDSTGQVAVASLPNEGQQTMANSVSVAIASDQGALTCSQATASSFNAEVQGDAAHAATISGNPLQTGAYAEADAAALDSTGVAEGEATRLKATLEGVLLVDNSHPNRFHANSGLSTATTLTQIQAAPGASLSLYITDIVMSASVASTTTTDQQLTLKYGTGSNCATGTTYITACFGQANGGCAVNLKTPIKLPANNALCWMHAAAGSKVVSVMGYTAP